MAAPIKIALTTEVIDFMKTWDCVNNEWFRYAHFIRRIRPNDGPPVFEIVIVEDTPQYVKELFGMIPLKAIAKAPPMSPEDKSELLDLVKKWKESDTQMVFVDGEPTISDLLKNPLVKKIVLDIASKAVESQNEDYLTMDDFLEIYVSYQKESLPRQEKVNWFLRKSFVGIIDGKAHWCEDDTCECWGNSINKSKHNLAVWNREFPGEAYITKEEVEHYNSINPKNISL